MNMETEEPSRWHCGDTSYSTAFLMEQDYGASGGYSSEGCILHTEEGKTYLYLQHQDDNDIRYLNLFDLSTGTPVYSDILRPCVV